MGPSLTCSAEHVKKTRQFLYRHGAEQGLAGQLTVSEEELTQFKSRVGVALDKMAAAKEQEREKVCDERGLFLTLSAAVSFVLYYINFLLSSPPLFSPPLPSPSLPPLLFPPLPSLSWQLS